jgi:hypothetical protein
MSAATGPSRTNPLADLYLFAWIAFAVLVMGRP